MFLNFLNICQPCRILQYIVTLVRLTVFANVYVSLANNPCDRIAGIPYIDSTLGFLTAVGYWFALPCLFYTLVNALVPSSKEGTIDDTDSTKGQTTINSRSQVSSKKTNDVALVSGDEALVSNDEALASGRADIYIAGKCAKLMTFLSFVLTKAIVLLEDTMGWVLKNYLVDLETMGSEVLTNSTVETFSGVFTIKEISKERDFFVSNLGAEFPWFKVLNVVQS